MDTFAMFLPVLNKSMTIALVTYQLAFEYNLEGNTALKLYQI